MVLVRPAPWQIGALLPPIVISSMMTLNGTVHVLFLAAHARSSAARTTANGCVRGSTFRIFSTESRRSPPASYSSACSRNASTFISCRWSPPASFISPRIEACGSCPTSSPARSADSSDLRNHSRSAVTMAILTALGRTAELATHVRAARRNGMTPEQISEVLLHATIYCGVPAGHAAFAVARQVLEEEDSSDEEGSSDEDMIGDA